MSNAYQYNDEFMTYAAHSSRYAAEVIVDLVMRKLAPASVLDVGCATGSWLDVWAKAGVTEYCGVDGDYVNRERLEIPQDRFETADLSKPLRLGRRFDLVQSLEVAEHVPPASSRIFVESLCAHADRFVLFSAAPPGQGGEYHVNEQPYDFWRSLFEDAGFGAFDFVRPLIMQDPKISFWYRYNIILFVKDSVIEALPSEVACTRIGPHERIQDRAPLLFRLRKSVVRMLPYSTQHNLARLKARLAPTGRF